MKTRFFTLHDNRMNGGGRSGLQGLRAALGRLAAAACLFAPGTLAQTPGSWVQGTDMPMPVGATPAVCQLDGVLYVIGGAERTNFNALNTVFAYDPNANSWTRKTNMPTARRFTAGAAVNGFIYVIGGSIGPFPGMASRSVEAYDPTTDAWTTKSNMPTARACLAACAVNGIIYAAGGTPDGNQQLATVEAYDPASGQWTSKRSMPQARWFLTASAVNGVMYVFHGTDVFAYYPQTNGWATKASHFSPYSWGLMSAEVQGIIFLFGGFTQDWSNGYDFTLAYDPWQDQFTARRRMPRKRATAGCAVIDGKIYLAGGADKEPIRNPNAVYYKILDVFDPRGGVTPEIVTGTLESPSSFRLVWRAEAGISYSVESSTNVTGTWTRMLLPTGWTVTATNAVVETTCTVSSGEAKRFFRVLEAK